MNVDIIVAFVAGVVIPLLVALIGKEPIGKFLYAKQEREQTALSAIISLTQESVAGWRDATLSINTLIIALERHDTSVGANYTTLHSLMSSQQSRLIGIDGRLSMLVHTLANVDDVVEGG